MTTKDDSPDTETVAESVRRGLAQSAQGQTVDLGDFTQYVPSPDTETVAREELWPSRPRKRGRK